MLLVFFFGNTRNCACHDELCQNYVSTIDLNRDLGFFFPSSPKQKGRKKEHLIEGYNLSKPRRALGVLNLSLPNVVKGKFQKFPNFIF